MRDGDAAVFMNFRADRARQLTRAFLADDFTAFPRGTKPRLAAFATLTRYADDIAAPAAFDAQRLAETATVCWSRQGLRQLRIAETEKYAHVTYFFSGGHEQPMPGEEARSRAVAEGRHLRPRASHERRRSNGAAGLRPWTPREFDAVVCNYANGDMVGHTGDFRATVEAVQVVDQCLAVKSPMRWPATAASA